MPLILASASPRRLQLLQQIDVVPDHVIPADVDETPRLQEQPPAYVSRMAHAKALAVAHPNAYVLGADTVVCGAQKILPKAEDAATARQCLQWLSSRRHQVLTAVAIAHQGKVVAHKRVCTRVKFLPLTATMIDHYIATGEWEGKAGGYAIQGHAQRFISFISGSYSNVVGLPLCETAALLKHISLASQSELTFF